METSKPIYLGDGVYAKFDGFQIEIYTTDGICNSESIYLDDMTADSLIEYIRKCFGGDQ